MAAGDAEVFEAFAGYLRDKDVDIAGGTWKVALVTEPITTLVDSQAAPALAGTNVTEVTAGGGYTAKGIALTMANTDTGGVVTLKLNTGTHTDGKITWTAQAGSPTDIKTAVVFDDAATSPVDACIAFIDMTPDGGTSPISLVAGDVTITFNHGSVTGAITTITA